MDLHVLWFVLLGALLTGYAMLDGFDLGVGILHFVARGDDERRALLKSIGPIWDGNEVWLVTFGGALFAAFPEAYATVFSGFYLAFMLVIFALIFRAVSIEFRGKSESLLSRKLWDAGFFLSSLTATLVFGVAVGAAMTGVPLNARGVFIGGLADQINMYSLSVGILAVTMFLMHGANYLFLKLEGELQRKIHRWQWIGFFLFLSAYSGVTVLTLTTVPRATKNFADHPWAWAVVALNVLAIANIPRSLWLLRGGAAFVSSCATIAALVFLFGIALFPNLVTSDPQPENSLTIYSAASSETTLTIMAIIAGIGMPFVAAYTAIVYWTFRGKVRMEEEGY